MIKNYAVYTSIVVVLAWSFSCAWMAERMLMKKSAGL